VGLIDPLHLFLPLVCMAWYGMQIMMDIMHPYKKRQEKTCLKQSLDSSQNTAQLQSFNVLLSLLPLLLSLIYLVVDSIDFIICFGFESGLKEEKRAKRS